MKHLFLLSVFGLFTLISQAQITITSSDMPVSGDSLRYSFANVATSTVDITSTGANLTWDFSDLEPFVQGVDQYKTAGQVDITYLLTISPTAYGYKVADSIPTGGLPLPINVSEVYTFFNKKSNPSRFVAEAFAANVAGLPTPANYSNEDEWYFFPLDFGDSDSSSFKLSVDAPGGFGSLKQAGYRLTTADGWGTIETPYYTAATPCLRVRSEIHEVDSVTFGTTSFALPRTTVEYKWLANGEHYPALWVTATLAGSTETPTNITYRDKYRHGLLGIGQPQEQRVIMLKAWPVPANGNLVTIDIPSGWKDYLVEVYDIQGRLAMSVSDKALLDISPLAPGEYAARVSSQAGTGFVRIVK
jgi:hypothetical protein